MIDQSWTGCRQTRQLQKIQYGKKTAPRYRCNLTVTTINNDFPAIECYTSSSNGIHLITLFSGCCLASGIPDCWVLSLYLASRSPANLKITEPEEHFNGCWNEHLFRQQLNFLPLRNFPGALHATHQEALHCCLLSFLHAGPPTSAYILWLRVSGAERGVLPNRTASETIYCLIAFRVFVGFYIVREALRM